ncbi:MAG: S9 family peptidase, partial [Bacteroidota bacterium]
MKRIACLLFLTAWIQVSAQENINYQKPPEEILKLVDVELAPSVLIDDKNSSMVLRYRDSFKSIAELSEKELRLAGLRINPKTNIGSRTTYYKNIKVVDLKGKNGDTKQVANLPANARLANFSWSPDQNKMAFTHTTTEGVEVWVLDIQSASAKKLTRANVNANMRDVVNWFEDSQAILVKMLPAERKPIIDQASVVPTGPTISTNDGKKAQNRTYQDLLKNKVDEDNFEQLATSVIQKVNMDGTSAQWLGSAMYTNISFSPDGNYVMITNVERPFSYLVPYYRFPSTTAIYSRDGKLVKTVEKVPLIEDLPKGFMSVRKGKRSFSWRSDKAASLVYAEALD